jgi:hypothetical protein
MDPVFSRAFVDRYHWQPVRLLGCELRPVCLGHLVLFATHGVPDPAGAWELRLEDIAKVLWILEADPCAPLHPERLTGILRAAGRAPEEKVRRAAERLAGHIARCCDAPEHWAGDGDGQMAEPMPYGVAWRLCQYGGMSIEQAWRLPVHYAMCLYSCAGEANGGKSLMSERERVQAEQIRAENGDGA